MRRVFMFLFVMSNLMASSSVFAFEGTLNVVTTSGTFNSAMNVFTNARGDMRIDSTMRDPNGKAMTSSMVMPAKSKNMYMIDHAQKRVMVMEKQQPPANK